MKRHLLFFMLFFSLLPWGAMAQDGFNLQGVVLDHEGFSLPGASVTIKGSSYGVATDFEGNFSINVHKGDILIVSFIGYQNKEVSVNENNLLTIILQSEDSSLDEVVITALGITRAEKTIGYATQQVDVNKVQEVATPNVGSLLSGQVAGLQVSNPPGMMQAPSFSLRGKSPLVVIDGIAVSTDFFDVSPEDIANINVLKGTSASVLYGSRGRNGAILITTKNAKQEGIEVTASQNLMISAGFTVYPKTQTQYGSGSNGQYEFWDGKDGGISDGDMIWGPKFDGDKKIAQWNSPILDKATGQIIPWYGSVESTQYNDRSKYERVPIAWQYHDNLKEFMQNGIISRTNFAVTNKSEKGSYRIGGEFSYNKDRVPNTSMYKGNLSFKSTSFLSDKFTLDSKFSYGKIHAPNVPNYGYNPSGHMYTILIWMGNDVNGRDLKNNLWVPGMEGYKQANYNYAWYNNPWFGAEYFKRIWDKDIVNSQLSLTYQANEDLVIQGRASAVSTSNSTEVQSPKSYFNYSASREGGFSIDNDQRLDFEYDILAMYNKDISNVISLNVNAGAASRYYQRKNTYSAADGLTVPGVYNLGNSTGNVTATNTTIKKAVNSVYGTIELDFYNAFFLTFAGRNDWSSTLSKANRSYFYPSASLSVMLSNLVSLPSSVDYLKLYTSWAEVSSDLDPYLLQAAYSPINPSFNGNQMVEYPNSILNPNLLPEKSRSFELGLSTSFLKRRLSMDLTYYRVVDSNFLIQFPVSEGSGFGSMRVNGNEYTTNGFEVSLVAKIVDKEDFSYSTSVNWSTKEKKLTQIYGGAPKYGNFNLNDRADSFYASVWETTPDGDLILDATTGLPTIDKTPRKVGNLDPKWILGWNNTFKYKNLGLNIGIDGIWGGVMRSEVVEKMWWGGKHPNSVAYRDQEYQSGQGVYVPKGVNIVSGELITDTNGNIVSDTRVYQEHTTAISWQTWAQNYPYRARVTQAQSKEFANIFDRTYFKLRTLAFSYDFTSLLKTKRISALSASLTGYNLFIWKKSKGLYSDPDYDTTGANDIQDPSSRWIGLGVNVKF
ncbi:SusC/RagA family TonB-linked outer membrane protein [Myroides sp. LJL116]